MGLIFVMITIAAVIWLYFRSNPLRHSRRFMFRRFLNWFPLGLSYTFLYMARNNLNVAQDAVPNLINNRKLRDDFCDGCGRLRFFAGFEWTHRRQNRWSKRNSHFNNWGGRC